MLCARTEEQHHFKAPNQRNRPVSRRLESPTAGRPLFIAVQNKASGSYPRVKNGVINSSKTCNIHI